MKTHTNVEFKFLTRQHLQPQKQGRIVRLVSTSLFATSAALILSGCPVGGELENGDEHHVIRNKCVTALFESRCDGAICHGAGEPSGGIDLMSPGVAARLLDQPATYPKFEACGVALPTPELLVSSASWETSVMLTKVKNTQLCGDGMPAPYQFSKLNEEQIECLENWILDVIAAGPGGGTPIEGIGGTTGLPPATGGTPATATGAAGP